MRVFLNLIRGPLKFGGPCQKAPLAPPVGGPAREKEKRINSYDLAINFQISPFQCFYQVLTRFVLK
jgi:hypothetical protein